MSEEVLAKLKRLEEENARLKAQLTTIQRTQLLSPPGGRSRSPSPSRSVEDGPELRIYPIFEGNGVEIVLAKQKKKKKKPSRSLHAKEKKKNYKSKKKRKPTVIAEVDVTELLPEGEHALVDAKRSLQQKLLKTYNQQIDLVEGKVQVEQLIDTATKQHSDLESFYLVDLGRVVAQYDRWKRNLPRVRPFYAVKSNPDVNIVKSIHIMGGGFDCASQQEIEQALKAGAKPSDIIYANPAKPKQHLLYAKQHGVLRMTFDNKDELEKIATIFPEAKLVLRLLPDDSHSSSPLGSKFGAGWEDSLDLMDHCKALKLDLIGVSYHVGSGCTDIPTYLSAVHLARRTFDEADKRGFKFTLLDIGGGWPGVDNGLATFDEIGSAVAKLIDELFPADVDVISEPGRYFCTQSYTLAVSVISKKEKYVQADAEFSDSEEESSTVPKVRPPEKRAYYYLSDSIYGSFNNIIFDHANPIPLLLKKTNADGTVQEDRPTVPSKLFGSTCDSIDVIAKDLALPDLEVGDWLYFTNFGAYTIAAASTFNGMKPPVSLYYIAL